jgi:hypothetical protein
LQIALRDQLLVTLQRQRVERERVLRLSHRLTRLLDLLRILSVVELRGIFRLFDLCIVGCGRTQLRFELCLQIGGIKHGDDLTGADLIAFVDGYRVGRLGKRARNRDVLQRCNDTGYDERRMNGRFLRKRGRHRRRGRLSAKTAAHAI